MTDIFLARIVIPVIKTGWFVAVGAYVLTRVWVLLAAAYLGGVLVLLAIVTAILIPISFAGWAITNLLGVIPL